jgi:hypothetical protein
MMAKLILEFDPFEEQREATHAVNGLKYYCALSEIEVLLRNKTKHGSLTTDQVDILLEVRDSFYDITQGLLDDH